MIRYEYLTIISPSIETLDGWGKKGWRVISVMWTVDGEIAKVLIEKQWDPYPD